ncbi:EthD domain-containing protein [Streptomyces sp. NBC_01320]|uniref:EthD domain-containing protein n=1 Tax=Streptomyces sp. NBC_01320 TaxID=2903824 RepID=UPI002E0FDC2F|nr:EthD domain-containing protein [Streptomyces sp. NBC_01320]
MVAVLSRKPGISVEEFRSHYEQVHVPLILSLVGPHLADYRRSYVDHSTASGGVNAGPGEEQLGFDVITETWYAEQAAFDQAMEVFRHPEHAERVRADELSFLDRSRKRIFLVDEVGASQADG